MEEKEQFDFTLEDIMREFGSGTDEDVTETPAEEVPVEEEPAQPEAETPEVPEELPELPAEAEPVEAEPVEAAPEAAEEDDDLDLTSDFWQAILKGTVLEQKPELEEDVRIFDGKAEPESKPAADLDSTRAFSVPKTVALEGDTVRLDAGAVAVAAEQAKSAAMGDTAVFAPVTEEQAAAAKPETAGGETEPFSQNWEPRYEEPMGEYVPPEPIVFRPRSRLSELKKKLVAGPERRYYALAELGLGKLQISIFLSCLVVLLSVASIVL